MVTLSRQNCLVPSSAIYNTYYSLYCPATSLFNCWSIYWFPYLMVTLLITIYLSNHLFVHLMGTYSYEVDLLVLLAGQPMEAGARLRRQLCLNVPVQEIPEKKICF